MVGAPGATRDGIERWLAARDGEFPVLEEPRSGESGALVSERAEVREEKIPRGIGPWNPTFRKAGLLRNRVIPPDSSHSLHLSQR